MNRFLCLFCIVAASHGIFGKSIAHAQNWPNWRGPQQNGVATGSDFPTVWSSEASDENVLWKVELPGTGGSTPIVWEQQIFVTSTAAEKNVTQCFDFRGKLLWQVDTGAESKGKHRKATGANPSPVTDGKHVFVYFKSGDMACLDLAGKIVWQKNLQAEFGPDTLWWDLGTSPVLTQDAVVVACMQSEPSPSYLVALAKETGEVLWQQNRDMHAPMEANQSYTTPIVLERDGQQQIIVLGADHVTCHAATTGTELWRVGGLNPNEEKYFRSISSPVLIGDMVIAPYARGQSLTAIRLGGSGDVTASHVAWTITNASSDVPTPTVLDGKIYVCGDDGKISCVDPATGSVIWSESLEKSRASFSASPIIAGNLLYATREDGVTFVGRIHDGFELLSTNPLDGDSVVATPVLTNGVVLLRTPARLYCIGMAARTQP